ncbi:MAG: response regulator [Gammaproteobacteria bacterium]|nr:response regulator [Gammaproteobacteria bacterium]
MDGFQISKFFKRPADKVERRARPRVPIQGEYTVLVVDDSRTVLHAVTTVLEQGGYKTLSAVDGDEAINLARQETPDVILMDVIMPGMNGFQATRILNKDPITKNIPIVIISSSEQPTEQAWCRRLGARAFLSKPIQRGELFPCLEELLELNMVPLI